jgi:cathepsin A (carboxypeptidase C)
MRCRPGQSGFNAAPVKVWNTPDGQAAGEVRSYETLTFLRVYNAGHMVPSDQPLAAITMLNTFLSGKSFYQ